MAITTLTPRGMLRDFVSLRDAMDRLFEESVIPSLGPFDVAGASFPADLYEEKDAYVLRASLPGMKPEELDIEATANAVSVSGEYKREEKIEGESYLRHERRSGTFRRSFALPLDVDPAKVEASFENGVLTVTLPKGDLARPKQIKIKPSVGK